MQELSNEDQSLLRGAGILEKHEVAYKAGDIVLAENMLNGSRRVLESAKELLKENSNRRVLKG